MGDANCRQAHFRLVEQLQIIDYTNAAYYVGGEGILRSTQGPNMQVMNISHARQF